MFDIKTFSVGTALPASSSDAGGFYDVGVSDFLFFFGRCVVLFALVGTVLPPG